MALSSLGQLVGSLEQRPQWRSHQQFQAILEHWPTAVGELVAAQTHPLAIRRQVLDVATSSSVWAQNLAFQRHHILAKLSGYIPDHSLKDIRFSPAQWRQLRPTKPQGQQHYPDTPSETLKTYHLEQSEARQLWSYHPCKLSHHSRQSESSHPVPHPLSPTQTFQDWATQVQARSQHLPKCPSCGSPTPSGELKRWGVCSLCATKKW
ncbi:MAG: DUF721 domain-containing protein [Leptolyngbyaceae cyanobacterium]